MISARLPSGEQHRIIRGDVHAVVVEVGGGLRTLQAGSLHVLYGYAEDEMCRGGRGQILMPWPNRLQDGRYTFKGTTYELPLTERARNNAIHGLVRWARWSAAWEGENQVVMTHTLFPSPGYPFTLDLSARYALTGDGLQVELAARNTGASACPFGAGQHPYIRVGTPTVDDAVLHVPARTMHRYNDRMIPVERIPVSGTPLDFRSPHAIGDTVIDMDYTDLERDSDGKVRVTLSAPHGGSTVEVWMDESFKHATVYTGDRHGLAVEPMTCPPNAFVSGDDLLVLESGESWHGRWGITFW